MFQNHNNTIRCIISTIIGAIKVAPCHYSIFLVTQKLLQHCSPVDSWAQDILLQRAD